MRWISRTLVFSKEARVSAGERSIRRASIVGGWARGGSTSRAGCSNTRANEKYLYSTRPFRNNPSCVRVMYLFLGTHSYCGYIHAQYFSRTIVPRASLRRETSSGHVIIIEPTSHANFVSHFKRKIQRETELFQGTREKNPEKRRTERIQKASFDADREGDEREEGIEHG